MELAKRDDDHFVFHLSKREKTLLLEVLSFYPAIPSSYQPLSRSAPAEDIQEAQQLLEEVLAEQKKENRKEVDAILKDRKRFAPHAGGYRLRLAPAQLEALLQILNDVRIGCWLMLGAPDGNLRRNLILTQEMAPYLISMEIAGYFESVLIEALSGNG